MGSIERVLDFAVEKGGELAQKVLIRHAAVATAAQVFGIGTTAVSLGYMVAEHGPEIIKASQYLKRKLVG